MGGINVRRWLPSGLAAAALIWLVEGTGSIFYMEDMQAAMAAHDLSMELDASIWVLSVIVSLLAGLTFMFFYAAARPRFGPGPATAVKVAVALWVGGYLLSLIGMGMIDLYPPGMLVIWGAVGLVEMILAAVLGAWIYREGELETPAAAAPSAPPPPAAPAGT